MDISKRIQHHIEKDRNLYNNKYISGYAIFVILYMLAGIFFPIKKLTAEQIHYIYSAIPQVLGALVGLLMAGYCFSSGLSAAKVRIHVQDDAKQIDKIISSIQTSNLGRFSLLSYFSFACILVSLLCIALSEYNNGESETRIKAALYPLCNIATALFIISLFLCYRVSEIFLGGKTLDKALNKVAAEIDAEAVLKESSTPVEIAPPQQGAEVEEEDPEDQDVDPSPENIDKFGLAVLPNEITANDTSNHLETVENLYSNIKKLTNILRNNRSISDQDLFQELFIGKRISQNNLDNLNEFNKYISILEIQTSRKTKIPRTLVNMTLRAYRKLRKIANESLKQ